MDTAIVAIIVFLLLITFHELGHFLVAKLVGVRVNEFSIGMGPELLHRKKNETTYSLRALPIGGYVSMEGEDEESEHPDSFNNATPVQRISIIAAGPFTNFLLAFLALILVGLLVGTPVNTIDSFTEISPAREAGILSGDKIIRIDGDSIQTWEDITNGVTKHSQDDVLAITVERDGREMEFQVHPVQEEGRYLIGIYPARIVSIGGALSNGLTEFKGMMGAMFGFIKSLFTGQIKLNALSGPIGVVSMIGDTTRSGFTSVLYLFAFLNINLGFVNLLPIPALDGSKILLYFIEILRGKPLSKSKEGVITMIGFVFLMALIVVVSIQDLSRILP